MAALPRDATIKALPQGFWSSFGYTTHDAHGGAAQFAAHGDAGLQLRHLPALRAELHHLHGGLSTSIRKFNFLRHLAIPVFGLVANLACMAFYLIGPFMGYGTKMEPLLALGIAAVWAIYGGIYFSRQQGQANDTGHERRQPTRLDGAMVRADQPIRPDAV